jgi:hypothetical protein
MEWHLLLNPRQPRNDGAAELARQRLLCLALSKQAHIT